MFVFSPAIRDATFGRREGGGDLAGVHGGRGGEDGGTEVDGGGAVEVEEGRVGGLGVGEVLRLGMIVVFGLWMVG